MNFKALRGSVVIFPAGGQGKRMQGLQKTPKIALKLGTLTVLERTLSVFQESDLFDAGILVLPQAWTAHWEKKLLSKAPWKSWLFIVAGGPTRAASVWQGLRYLKQRGGCRWVAVHDAVRPLVLRETLQETMRAARRHGAAVPVIRPADTLWTYAKAKLTGPLDRGQLVRAQTPQIFRYDWMEAAYRAAAPSKFRGVTDDAGLLHASGKKVRAVPGHEENLKITTPLDYQLAKLILKDRG